jgi:hypothetical protein
MTPGVALLAVLGFPVLLAASAVWRGYVLSILWGWFAIPAFGLPALSIPFAIGISLITSMLTSSRSGREAEKPMTPAERFWNAFGSIVLGPALVLVIGWIVQKSI